MIRQDQVVESNTRSIVELAWARRLGLPDHALLDPHPEHLVAVHDDQATFVRLWSHTVLAAPERLLALAVGRPVHALQTGSLLLALAREAGHLGARVLGEASLAYTDSYAADPDPELTVIADRSAVVDVERSCPPDDVAEVALADTMWCATMLDGDSTPMAAAGFDEWQQLLGHLGVLTRPTCRRRGWALAVASVACNETLDRGLVPQWRARLDNAGGQALSRRLGFEVVGHQATVALNV